MVFGRFRLTVNTHKMLTAMAASRLLVVKVCDMSMFGLTALRVMGTSAARKAYQKLTTSCPTLPTRFTPEREISLR